MKKKIIYAVLTYGIVNCIISCGDGARDSKDCKPMEISRLDRVVYDYPNLSDEERRNADSMMSNGVSAVLTMLNMGHPDDSAYIKYVHSDAVKMFSPEVERCFEDITDLEQQLGCVKANIEKELPQVKFHDIYAIVSPYRQSIYITDSTLLLSLNHYLGKNHKVYDGFDEYIKKTKEVGNIPYDVVEALIGSFYSYEPQGNDIVLAKMLYAGAIAKTKMLIVPNASLAKVLGYDDDELEWLEDNEQSLWNSLVSKELLYSSDYLDIERLLFPSPRTTILNVDAPGRVGRYLGYKIVEAYLKKNPNTTLQQLFTPEFYQSTQSLIESGYQGK